MTAALIAVAFLALTLLRQNVILTLGVIVGLIHVYAATGSSIEYLVQDLWFTLDREVLLSVPMFIFAGVTMSRGSIAARLVRIMTALTSFIPGGLGVATILTLAVFSALTGSGVVTMMAVGALMYPAMIRNNYSPAFAVGMLASGGTLGVIIPPSILMIFYGMSTDVSVVDMFKAGWGPGLLMVVVLAIYAVVLNRHQQTSRLDVYELFDSLRHGLTALMMPVVLLGGVYSGYFTITEAAAVSVLYALVVEMLVHREVGASDIYDIAIDTVKLIGALMPIVGFAGSLNTILAYEGIPQDLVAWAQTHIHTGTELLVAVTVLLLIAGALMDEASAIVILAPLLAPLAAAYGFDPVHFAIIVIVNLQIGYVMPPVAINVMVASIVFEQSFGAVCRAVIPFILLMLLVLLVTIVVPELSLYFVR